MNFGYACLRFQEAFRVDSWNVLFPREVFPLGSQLFVLILIRPWISSLLVCINSFGTFISFSALVFIGFISLCNNPFFFFQLSRFLLTTNDYIRFLVWLVCFLQPLPLDEVFIFIIRSMSFIWLLISQLVRESDDNEFCLHNQPYRNCENLADLSLENSLSSLNTKFQKSEGKLKT